MSTRPNIINRSVRDSLTINHFIYHIIETDKANAEHLDQVTLTPHQEEVFKDMIVETARGTRYVFSDRENNALVDRCSLIIEDPTTNFVRKSKLIVDRFRLEHESSFSDGVVVVAHVSMTVNTFKKDFIAILKLDYTKVLTQRRDRNAPTHVSFDEISDSLAEDKSAIQKRALVDISDTFDWDVLAVERNKSGTEQDTEKAITQYFKRFLGVRLQKTDSSYARIIPSNVYKWAKGVNASDASDKRAKAYNLIAAHDGASLNMDNIKAVVCATPEEEHSFDNYMDDVELNGVEFTARKNSLLKSDQITKLINENKVQIIYPGEMSDVGIEKIDLGNGVVQHIITSSDIEEVN